MPQSPINEALAKLENVSQNNLSGKPLDTLEALFEQTRNFAGNFRGFLEDLLDAAFWRAQDYAADPYRELCLKLASCIDSYNGKLADLEPPYHSRKHFQDVCLALTALLEQDATPKHLRLHDAWNISPEEAWILLFCAIAHDFGHTGLTNTRPFELETISIEKARAFLNEHCADPTLKSHLGAKIEPVILATDPLFFAALLAKFTEPSSKPSKLDCLSMLMVEADLLASTLPVYGKTLGKLLAQEWISSNPRGAATVESDQGRLKFLKGIRFVSPQAIMLKMEDIRNYSIEQLKD